MFTLARLDPNGKKTSLAFIKLLELKPAELTTLVNQMIMVKRILIFCLAIFLTSSCDKDKDKPCTPPVFAKNIIGTWQGSLKSSPKQLDEISFLENGTFEEKNGMLFGKQNEPVITWTAEKDSLKISGKFKNNTSAVYAFSAMTNTCDSIVLDVEGIDKIFLKRK